jgi:hypothetical protein
MSKGTIMPNMNSQFSSCMPTHLMTASILMTSLLTTGCGGGEDSGTSSGGYYAVQGIRSTNSAVYTVCIDNAEFTDPKSVKGGGITSALSRYYGLSNWVATSGTGEGCASRYPHADTIITVDYYNNTIANSTSTPTPTPSPTQYIPWSGSVNGTLINDKDDESFQAVSSSGQIFTKSGTQLTGLKVSGSTLLYNGSQIGYIGFASAQGGDQLAQMYCSNGEYLDIILSSASWQYKCNGVTSNGGSTNGSPPGNTATRSFITWTGSANGPVVLDATDERFRFYADSKCIFSDNTQKEYTNFCLSGNSSTVYFNGNTYTVAKILSTTRQCIVGLVTSDGYFADIYTGSDKVETITTSSSRPTSC